MSSHYDMCLWIEKNANRTTEVVAKPANHTTPVPQRHKIVNRISTFLARYHHEARWPSGLRRQLKVIPDSLVRKGVGSNPTLVNISFVSVFCCLYDYLTDEE